MPSSFGSLAGGQAVAGPLHIHDGNGGMIFVTKTGIVNASQTIIPDGTGDVLDGMSGFFVISDGSSGIANAFTMLPGDNLDTVVGSGTIRLALAAGGALTVIRQSGTGTYSIAIMMVWI